MEEAEIFFKIKCVCLIFLCRPVFLLSSALGEVRWNSTSKIVPFLIKDDVYSGISNILVGYFLNLLIKWNFSQVPTPRRSARL